MAGKKRISIRSREYLSVRSVMSRVSLLLSQIILYGISHEYGSFITRNLSGLVWLSHLWMAALRLWFFHIRSTPDIQKLRILDSTHFIALGTCAVPSPH